MIAKATAAVAIESAASGDLLAGVDLSEIMPNLLCLDR
jgi:hypothetical protein